MRPSPVCVLLGSIVLAVVPRIASADSCATEAPLLLGVDPEVRLHFLAGTFDREIRDVDI